MCMLSDLFDFPRDCRFRVYWCFLFALHMVDAWPRKRQSSGGDLAPPAQFHKISPSPLPCAFCRRFMQICLACNRTTTVTRKKSPLLLEGELFPVLRFLRVFACLALLFGADRGGRAKRASSPTVSNTTDQWENQMWLMLGKSQHWEFMVAKYHGRKNLLPKRIQI